MEVEIISRESIKPSTPTPPHLKTYKISLLDQLIPSSYAAVIFHYIRQNTHDVGQFPKQLKPSLSQTLTLFPPLAGKFTDDFSAVECNGEGALYVEARTKARLAEFLSRPGAAGSLSQFLPVEPMRSDPSAVNGGFVTAIQVTAFDCGGVAVGVCASHRIADAEAVMSFVKSWAATCHGSTRVIRPSFTASGLFPQNGSLTRELSAAPRTKLLKSGRRAVKRFVFDGPAITAMRERASGCGVGASTQRAASRVEAVSGVIWWRAAAAVALAAKRGGGAPAVLSYVVNFRRKVAPPFPENSFGNFIWTATARIPTATTTDIAAAVGAIRAAVDRIDGDFVRSLQGEEGFSRVCECIREAGEVYAEEGVDYLSITSVCNSGMYGIDFGWGKPVWVRVGISENAEEFMNLVFLMDTGKGDGVEAWVMLGEEEMAIFERDPQILAVAAVDPGALSFGYSSL